MREKHQSDSMQLVLHTALVFVLIWSINVVKFTRCDFQPDYQCEVIHGIGLIGIPAIITVWFGDDNN